MSNDVEISEPESSHTSTKKVGRPRLLTLDMVLDAANEMGIENVNMKKLAAELGVGIATIYRYVVDRDQLVQMALTRRVSHPFIVTDQMDWRDVICGYAESLFSVLSQDSFALNTYMKGGLGVTAELEFIDTLIEALEDRGFSPNEAGRICRLVGHQVGGAAMGQIHNMALNDAGTTRNDLFAKTLASYDSDDLMHIRSAANALFDERYLLDWRPGVDLLIEGIEARRAAGY